MGMMQIDDDAVENERGETPLAQGFGGGAGAAGAAGMGGAPGAGGRRGGGREMVPRMGGIGMMGCVGGRAGVRQTDTLAQVIATTIDPES